MFFRNLTIYQLPAGWTREPDAIEATLAEFPLHPCSGQIVKTRGWVPVTDDGRMTFSDPRRVLLSLGTEEKLLPARVVNQATEEKVSALEKEKGFKIGRRHRREIKEQVQIDLLPRAFSQRTATHGWLDFEKGWLVVDTASPNRADEFTQALRDALGELPATPMASNPSMGALMTQWLSAKQAPGAFTLDDHCELTTCDENKSTVRYTRHALDGADINAHLTQGKVTTRLSLAWNDRISFQVNDKLQIRQLKFLDIESIRDKRGELEADEVMAADFALFSGELQALLGDLAVAVGANLVE
ncbi:recombination-associated protein RdgC [Sinimarinibacterium sp. CAU 1509]|uniref:recombination-associated protein RdgC n=1 Tax=Sinimarinibacterium sp. CAU 1509 TaxID=2562283 RepID=UPI00146F92E5|nr:recombination-associated protein RdgC [Sinimarinibacterium sp. CAU 1509]